MYRRTGIVLFVLLTAWGLWIYPKPVTYERGKSIDYSEGKVETVYVTCGQALDILSGDFGDSIPSTAFYMQSQCTKAARSRVAGVAIIGVLDLASLIIGLFRGPAPKVAPIDAVLDRLPPPRESSSV